MLVNKWFYTPHYFRPQHVTDLGPSKRWKFEIDGSWGGYLCKSRCYIWIQTLASLNSTGLLATSSKPTITPCGPLPLAKNGNPPQLLHQNVPPPSFCNVFEIYLVQQCWGQCLPWRDRVILRSEKSARRAKDKNFWKS